jgi:hypothetical protein
MYITTSNNFVFTRIIIFFIKNLKLIEIENTKNYYLIDKLFILIFTFFVSIITTMEVLSTIFVGKY